MAHRGATHSRFGADVCRSRAGIPAGGAGEGAEPPVGGRWVRAVSHLGRSEGWFGPLGEAGRFRYRRDKPARGTSRVTAIGL